MSKREPFSSYADDLRRRAEEKVRGKLQTQKDIEALKESERLVHELRVHQIELEMQNEELRKYMLTVEEMRDRYIDLYDFAPVGYFTFTREALIKEVNLTGAELLGVERRELINARFRRFVAPEDHEKWDRYLLGVFEPGEKQVCDLKLRRDDGSLFMARFDSMRLDVAGKAPSLRTAMSDITKQKKAEVELQKYSVELQKKNKELVEALAKVKTLSGMLPICASCKKIRDDKGYWNQVEAYISEHSEAIFSHGICPECEKKSYAELDSLRKQKDD